MKPSQRLRLRRVARRLDPLVWLAGAWAFVALRRTRAQLTWDGLNRLRLPPPPPLPEYARRGVVSVLARLRATCLMEAVILQQWDAAHGRRRDLVIGVTAPSEGFQAHAWLDGDLPCHEERFRELVRRPV